jgi:hypothetical protein
MNDNTAPVVNEIVHAAGRPDMKVRCSIATRAMRQDIETDSRPTFPGSFTEVESFDQLLRKQAGHLAASRYETIASATQLM